MFCPVTDSDFHKERRGGVREYKKWWMPLAVFILLAAFFAFLFYFDNKYQTPPPYGKAGVMVLQEQDLESGRPIFLIDGWLFSDEHIANLFTYIGEFSNLSRGDMGVSPHGRACYELILRYEGASKVVSVDFPEISSRYEIFLDGKQLAEGVGNGEITFLLTPGSHLLRVETSSKLGYYSGMYFPPALGTMETLSGVDKVQGFAYAVLFVLPLALAGFTLFLWRTGGKISRCFGLLCCCHSLYVFRYFVFLFSMPVAEYWFLVQNLAFYGLCFCVVRLTALTSLSTGGKAWRRIKTLLLALPVGLLLLSLFTRAVPWAVFVHGKVTDFYYLFTFFGASFFAVRGMKKENWESQYTLIGCVVFGVGMAANLFFSNRFEPIRFFWQYEWCSFLLVLLFGAMMVSRSRRLLRENDMLTNHLEEQVKKRTEEVTKLLEERKAFFSDMAHDLKAPVFATRSFIQAIRKSGVGVDAELQGYLNQAEAKQQEMARRLQGLSELNALDKIKEEPVRISVRELLAEVYEDYHGEAEVQSVYLSVEAPEEDGFFVAQPEKLHLLFENLVYNALKATPCEGSITISGKIEEDVICLIMEDTGCGIPEEELPFIFQRFYVGSNNRQTGTGLGLYIVHSIVEEMRGRITASSTVGKGTKFVMEFPKDGLPI